VSAGVKPGVKISGLTPEMAFGAALIINVFNGHRIPLVFTSCMDGKHGAQSLHYVGKAVDIRLPSRFTNDPVDDDAMVVDLKLNLGEEWDVVLEADHIHVEHDPDAIRAKVGVT
jgi:hypothetical protein